MTIRLLHQVADEQAGAVIEVEDRRAQRLIRTGYAEAMTEGASDGGARADSHADHGRRRPRR